MRVADIMTQHPVRTNPSSTLHHALRLMEQTQCHHLPVVSEEGHLIGLITAEACHQRLRGHIQKRHKGDLQAEPQVRSAMTLAPIIVEPDTPAEEAARLMVLHHVSGLPVMRGETLVGIVTSSDLLIAFMELVHQQQTAPPTSA